MDDDTDYHRAAMNIAKRGVTVGILSLVVALLAFGYTIFADFGGVEWTKSAVGGWFAESSENPDGTDAAGDDGRTASETPTPESDGDSEDSGSDKEDGTFLSLPGRFLKDVGSDIWPFKPGLSFWIAFWNMALVGLVYMAGSFLLKLAVRKKAAGDGLVSWFLIDSAVVLVMLLWAAIDTGEGFASTALMIGAALLQTIVWVFVGFIVVGAMYPGPERADSPTQE